MKLYHKSRQLIKGGANKVSFILDKNKKGVRTIRLIIIILFTVLIVADIIFVSPSTRFPTISKVVLLSSPKNLFLIWLWGVTTANLFFPRKIAHPVQTKIIGLLLLIIITITLYFFGVNLTRKYDGLTCDDSRTTVTSFYTEIICYNKPGNTKVDCFNDTTPCSYVRVDIKTWAKALLIIMGMVFGYFLWPQIERTGNSSVASKEEASPLGGDDTML
jgi:hypothetical protein